MRLYSASVMLMVIATPISVADAHDDPGLLGRQIPKVALSTATIPEAKANLIVVYSASWCVPCQRLKPVIVSLKKEGYRVVSRDVDTDRDRLLFDYTAVPTIFFLSGETVIKKETGYRSKAHIKKTLMLKSDLTMAKPAGAWN